MHLIEEENDSVTVLQLIPNLRPEFLIIVLLGYEKLQKYTHSAYSNSLTKETSIVKI